VITYNGVPFRWPDAAVGEPDNVTAAGQALTIGGSGSTLAFLLTAGSGLAQGTAKVAYASGSTQKFTIRSPDWATGCPSADSPGAVAYTAYHNEGSAAVCLYYTSVRLQPGQTVTRIVLPDLGPSQPQIGDPSLHIFAITIY
jgi:alpha-L-fucosidase 2